MAATHTFGVVVVACPADELFDMVADVTRMGEWSPVCKACWWDGRDGPAVGSTVHRTQRGARTDMGDAF